MNLKNIALSSNQNRLWIQSQLDPSDPSNNIHFAYHIEGEINVDILNRSIELIFEKHHTLHSVFESHNGVPSISIVPKPVLIESIDFSGFLQHTVREEILQFSGSKSRIPFDLEKGPLYRIYILKENERSWFFNMIIHNIIFDSISRRIFIQELNRIYNNLIQGINEIPEPLKYHSYDFVGTEIESLSQDDEMESIGFWKEYLKDCPPGLKFPYDHIRTNIATRYGHTESFQISRESSINLRKITKECDTSLFKTLLPILGILFNKYTGDKDICIGIPVSNRSTNDSLKVIGSFVDTIPLRMIINEEENISQQIRSTSEIYEKTIQYKLPFDKIVRTINPERITGLNPFYQISFFWLDNINIPMELGGISGKRITIPLGVEPFDITFYMWENDDVIEGEIQYNTDLFKPDTIIRLLQNMMTLIDKILENKEISIKFLSMVSAQDLAIIERMNDTRIDYPKDKTIIELFEEQVNLYPDKHAVVFKDNYLTYNQLNEKVNQLARVLRNAGLIANDPVAILVERSIEMIIGIYGILKAGGCYVPIDPEYPQQRIDFIIRDSGSKIIITQDKFISIIADDIIKFSLDSTDSFHQEKSNVSIINVPTDLAYIIFTSGTTGIPKGSLIRHRGVVRLVRNNYIVYTPDDKVLLVPSFVFDMSIRGIFGSLLNGSTLYITDKETLLDVNALGDLLLKNEITIMTTPTALFIHIAELSTDIFCKLKVLTIGGDVLSAPHVNKVRKNNPQLTVINTYGPTENSTNSTNYKVDRDFDSNIPIGKPINNSTAYIFDKNMNYQPIGIIGELYVGGDGVSPGYLNRDDLNSSRFVQHPFKPAERLYKTGDYTRWLPDGNIEFHGRMDNQLKIRGFRVELGEIESLISQIDGIVDVVVKPLNSTDKDIRLIAFLNVPEDFKMDTREILGILKSKLPSYMIPYGIKLMHGFPLTINGKTDKRALIYEERGSDEISRKQETLSSATEEKLYNIWSEILRTKDIGRNESFFESGGNSLLAISLMNKITLEFGISISFRDLIIHSTIADLGKYIDENSSDSESSAELVHLTDLNNLPLTQSQARIWLITKLNPEIPNYILPYAYSLNGPLKIDIFRRSIDTLFSRHHVLFSRIIESEGVPCCIIEKTEVHIEFTDYSDINIDEGKSRIFEFINKDARRIFDLTNGPLYRLYLFKLSDEEFCFYSAFHHIVSDGWSWKVFIDDLNQIYNDLDAGREISLKELPYQQYDFAHWEKQTGLLKDETKLIDYWKRQLEGCSSLLNFPHDFTRLKYSTGFGEKVWIQFPASISAALRQISKNEGVSLFATMMSAFGILLNKYSGDNDINIGTPVANRSHSSFESVIGMFVNTLAIRMQLDQEISFKNLLRRTNEAILDGIAYQDLQFEKIVEIVNPERFSDANPIFQVIFAWEDNLSTSLHPGKVNGKQLFIPGSTSSSFDLSCALYNNGDCIEGSLIYNCDLISKDTAVRLCDNFLNLVSNLVVSYELPIASVAMISDKEIAFIEKFNDTRSDYPGDKSIVQLFEEQVSLFPDKRAIVFKDDSLTYEQLNSKSNQLAFVLRNKGVKTNDPVGILADKSIDMIVGILGILKAGGAYMPLDPEYPDERRNYVIMDSGCRILLTQEKYINLAIEGVLIVNLNSHESYYDKENKVENINTSSDLAYILYTSGTTGKPKGSLIRHQSVVRLVRNTNYIDFPENIRTLLVGAIVFDLSAFEIWGTLLNGGSLYIIEKETILDHKALGIELISNEINILLLSTGLFTYLAESGTDIFRSLKYLLVAGDVLSAPHINNVRKNCPLIKVINGYGPTENAVFSTCFEIDRDYDHNIPIGKPISNSTAYIFDKNMNYQPIGIIGELYVGGDGVSPGYLNRDDLNRKSFVQHPYIPEERLYKTGDYARWLPDGNIEFHGRMDNQLKIRGFRIELGEIESLISQIDGIVDVVVKPLNSTDKDIRLIAFLNVPEDFKMDTREILGILKSKLPSYMIPYGIKLMNGFPLTINGKTDKKALIFNENESEGSNQEEELFTTAEEKVLKLWSELLRTREFRRNDNFFDAGGNSLLAISLINKLKNELGVSISYRDLIIHSSIADLGKYIDENSSDTESTSELVHLTDLNNLPLTQSQARIWLITQLNPSIPNYLVPLAYRLNGPLKIDIFQRSIDALFSRHHVLFSRIIERESVPFCIIEETEVHIEFTDYSDINIDEGESRIFEFINKDTRRIFDLTNGPLYRLYLFKLSEEEFCFYCAFHHIVFDGWSWKVFIDDLNQIYNDLDAGREISLKELPYQQYDFAHWEKQTGLLKDETKLIDYWKRQLEGCSSLLNFPHDFTRLKYSTGFGEKVRIQFPASISAALRQISKNEGVSLYATMMSAFGILLNKYSGDNDINIGAPVANRSHSSFESVIGMFVNTLAIRIQLDQEISFKNLLRRTNEAILDAITYQDLQFEKIVDIVNPERFSDANPIFQVILAWEDNLNTSLHPGKVNGKQLFIPGGTSSSFDLSCALYNNGDCIEGSLLYNCDLISKDTAVRLCDNFLNLVSNLVASYELPISSVAMISDEEKNQVLKFTDTKTPYPKDKTIAQLFVEQASLYPNKKAVVFQDYSLTYDQLNSKANQLARVLRNSGVRANDPVAIMVDRSVEMIVGIFGILKAGGAYVPIDPEYPELRKSFILKDSGCRVIITQNKYISENVEGIKKVSLDSSDSYHNDSSDVEIINVPTDLAYILYTSGTTGNPKGTLLNSRGVIRMVRNNKWLEYKPDDNVLLIASIVFDASTEELFGALLNGATLSIADKETILDVDALGELLIKDNITVTEIPTALFIHIAELSTDIFCKLRVLIVGGDVLPASHVNKVRKNNPQLTFINAYGPTENSCNSATFTIDRDYEGNIPIGKPISNSTAYIFDKNMNYQPIGIIGELYVGGDGVSPGYLNREDLNRKSFLQHPYIPGERLYKTGDYARWLPDGNIEFHGRMDNQLKIRGFRVELGEIESLISQIDGIVDVVVKPLNSTDKDIRLIAFLNVPEDFKMDTREILGLLKSKLPSYMIPYGIKLMHGFPLTINGKTDKKALIYEEGGSDEISKKQESFSSGTEEKLYIVWSEVLRTKDIGRNDSFFESGGNSLLAISLMNKITLEFGISISFRDLIIHSSIADLGKYIDENSSDTESSAELVHLTDLSSLPLTQSQARIWLITKLNQSIPNYIVPFAYRLNGPLKIDIFRRSIDALFSRHHVLFSRIIERDGVPFCNIEKTEVHIEFTDYSNITRDEGESRLFEFINRDSRRIFDLTNGPLYRLYLFKLSEEEFCFYCAFHHIVFDGWSWKIFIDDLNQIYNDLEVAREISLKELPYQQYDFAHWEKQTALLKDETELIKYWKSQLEGCSTQLNFPFDFPRLNNSTGFGENVKIQFPPSISSALRQISKNEGVSLFATMMSTFGILLNKYSGDNDINIGTPVANRSHSSFESVIGMFVNTLVIRLQLDQEISFSSLLRKTNEVILDAITYQDLQFEKIVEIVNPERFSNANPVFQVAFAWGDNLSAPLDLGGVKGERVSINRGTSLFDLTCSMYSIGDRIEGTLIYNIDLISKDAMIRLCDNFVTLVSNLVNNSEVPISSVPIITNDEKQKILGFTETTSQYPKDKTIVRLFEEKVTENPHKNAVVFHNDCLTYDQLNRKSNQLARTLREKAEIKRDTPIGILADKSTDLIVGILSILKSGGAYVPIDPEYPQQRIDFIIRDSGCRIILTQDKYINLTVENVLMISLNSSGSYNTDESNVENINSATDLAYIMYTSGTTGVPKGSMIEQKSVVRLVRNTNYIDLHYNIRTLMIGAVVFDATTFEIWGTLLNGGSLYIVEKEIILDTKNLGEELIRNDINTLLLTSGLFTHLAESRTNIFGELKYLLVGGDVLSVPHINKVRKNNPMIKVINVYGPTENTTFSTCFEIDRDYDHNIPIGKPISNSTAYIFDKNMNYQPIGIIGELYVGGDGVSPGYLNRDDLNRKSFLQHPYIPGERLYKTGDYARWLPDGNIEFHGRMDNQLKIRGFRVELGEIESLISQLDGIVDVVVKPLNSTDKDIRLIAFLNVPEDFKMDTREILGILKSKLPSYMIPYGIKLMHGFPLTINGKTDRKALIFNEDESAICVRQEEEVLTAAEEKVLKLWSEILRTKEIRRNDNFFDSGGNSLLAISLINKLENELRVSLSYRDLIMHSTIADLGKYIDENSSDTESSAELVHLTDLSSLPLTKSQARIWLITKLNPEIPNYIVPFAYRLNGPLKIDIFRRSIDALFSRHHVLFSRIIEKEGVPFCIIEKTEVHIEFTDYSDINIDEGESQIFEFINKDARRIFDLTNGPLYRLYLFKLSEEEFCFYCAFHHIVFDGWSWKIFIDDLNQIYSESEAGMEISLKELEYQQYDFAHWEKQTGVLKDETKLIKYWKSQLEGCSTQLNFPFDFPRLNNSTGFGENVKIQFSPEISSALRQISKNEGVSLFATMMSTFGILLNKYSGDNDINIGTPVANRSHSSFESVIGMFVNTLVIRLQLDQEISFSSLLRRTNEVILDAITYQDLQFEKIVEIVNPERFSNANPVFQVAFAWGDNLSVPLDLGSIKGEPVSINGGTSLFDITCTMYSIGDRIEGTLIYNIDLISKDTMVRLCDNFVTLVSNLINNSEVPISSVPIITDDEKLKILRFTETTSQYPKDKTIVRLFEEIVTENPHKNAVVFHNDCLTYDQLNRKSNQLARTLREKAEIKRDTPIGILADKSTDLIVGILSILKSGGAYVPIDPEYPQQRIDFIIRDSGCRIILTQDKYMNLTVENVLMISLNSSGSYSTDESNVENINSSTDLAYIMYTSGTTGVPKGSMIEQQSVVRLVRNTNYIDLNDNTRILLTGAIVFDASTFEIWGTLLNGGSLYIVEKETILDTRTLGQELLRNDINTLWLTSALFTNLAESSTNIFSKLKYLLVGGDVLSVPHINKVRKENPDLKVINGYGPTENTTFSTCFEINREYDRNIPIGKPISNSTAYIFDKSFNYQPIGVKGELYVGGDGVSRGYLNRHDLNIIGFIKHPYNPGEKLYKTGDYARWLPDGNIEFHGRTDNQVKIRGYRIELEEIEAVLSEIEGVREAVVKPIRIDENDVRLVAYLKVPMDFSIGIPEVSKRITGKLPPYMVPYFYKTMHEFPITVNGKIDRKSLTIDLSEIKEEKVIEISELTSTQIRVLKIWQDIIKTRSIGLNDNFFDAGGTSLLAVRVVDRIEKEFDITFELRHFFNNPIIQKIAEHIDIKINPAKIPGINENIQTPEIDNKIIIGEL